MSRYVKVAEAREVLIGRSKVVEVEGRRIVVFNVDGTFAAAEDECPHLQAPLGEGAFKDGIVKCPWHDWTFDPLSGECLLVPHERLCTYPVRVDGGDILVDIESPSDPDVVDV